MCDFKQKTYYYDHEEKTLFTFYGNGSLCHCTTMLLTEAIAYTKEEELRPVSLKDAIMGMHRLIII